MDTPKLHADCTPLQILLGTWTGEGHGRYPTIPPFDYGEEVRFWHVGKPHLLYAQRTWNLATGMPMHTEMGYFRPHSGGRIEIVLAHPTGIAEIEEGTLDGGVIETRTMYCVETTSAKEVTALARRIRVDGDTLAYELEMAAVGQPLLPHLSATLKRTG